MRGIETKEIEIEKEKEYSNPKEYFKVFLNWDKYKRALANRIKERKEENPFLRDEEIEKGFLNLDKCKDLLWDFHDKEGVKLKYDEQYYSQETQEKLKEYWEILNEMRKQAQKYGKVGIPEEIATPLSLVRIAAHNQAAASMIKDGLFLTETVARNMIRFMTIEKGYELTREEDETRREFIEAQLSARV